jgi:hypothetical protein
MTTPVTSTSRCPDRSQFAAMDEIRRPFVFCLAAAPAREGRDAVFHREFDALGLDIWWREHRARIFPRSTRVLPFQPAHALFRHRRRCLGARSAGGLRLPRFSPIQNRRAVGSPRSNASVPNQTLHAICARRVAAKPGVFHPGRRGNKKARLTLPCNPRKLYMVERPLRQEPRRGSS